MAKQQQSLTGTWERQGLTGARQLKTFSDTHFTWTIFELGTGKPVGVGGGTYQFDGNTLTETYEFSSVPQLMSRQLTLTIKFNGPSEYAQVGVTTQQGVSQDETYRRASAKK